MLTLQGVTYAHPNRDLLFSDIDLIINKQDKIALTGNNGVGKSSLLKLLSGHIRPSKGIVKADSKPYYVPQLFGQYNNYTIAEALQIDKKLKAFKDILNGEITDRNMALLDNDWAIEERCKEALSHWGISDIDLARQIGSLSGGQKTKVFLAGISIHRPEIVLLDEPSNHLDTLGREILYDYIRTTKNTLVVVSHDRTLLNLLDTVYELSNHGVTIYGGNYDFYQQQKMIETEALNQDVRSKEKALRKAKEIERESMERQQKLDSRGKKKQSKAGIPTIVMNTLRNKAENSTSRAKTVHAEKVSSIAGDLNQLRRNLSDLDKMKMDLDSSRLRKGKILVTAKEINFGYTDELLWQRPLSIQISSGERISLKGSNGSGKTTLVKILLAQLQPAVGTISRSDVNTIYFDQDYSLIDNALSVYQQAQQANSGVLQEHDIKIRLNRFLFSSEYWDKPCGALSGGEKMRLMLCTLTISNQAPDMIILDEPTNNLDIQNMEILTAALTDYNGTLIVISHDGYFLDEIRIDRTIDIDDAS